MNDLTTMLLDSYFAGTLPPEMAAWLESCLAEEPDLRREVEAHRLTIAALRESGRRNDAALTDALSHVTRAELEEALKSLRIAQVDSPTTTGNTASGTTGARANIASHPAAASIPAVKSKPKHRLLWNMLTAAALVCGVWFGARTFYLGQSAQQTADTYIASQSAKGERRGAARGADEPLGEQIHDWSTDTVCLTDVAPQYDDMELLMARANNLLQNGLYDEAISLLEPVYRESGELREVGLLLATAYIKAEEKDKAQAVLQALNERYANDPEVEALTNAYTD